MPKFWWFSSVVVLTLALWRVIGLAGTGLLSPAEPAPPPVAGGPITPPPTFPSLADVIDQALTGARGDYAVVVKNFRTNEQYLLQEHKRYVSGSLYKLWIAAEAYDQIEAGELALDEPLLDSAEHLNEIFGIDPAEAELTGGNISLTVAEALEQMITISHNYAAFLLAEKVRVSRTIADLSSFGGNESSLGSASLPETTAADMAAFLEKLYQRDLVGKQSSEDLINLLSRQKRNEGIPKYLPEGVQVAHKTGEIDFFKHDVGLVISAESDYLIVVLSQSDFPDGAQERIALISKAVFDYFQKS